jgi:hypothetical protein
VNPTILCTAVQHKLNQAGVGFDIITIGAIISAIFAAFKACNPVPTPAAARQKVLNAKKMNGSYRAPVLNPATKVVLD